ncbi:RTA1 like protein-domain-containing protein [Pseudoneurospora amorphoporcata]|uniref:RTA1 like protein-domain-containing protein n=1 Tax=Pseudoneurospora amorphoporcata TaxID=241081 RepID=A0AAN6NXK7_9PEZI|nr:RTA1 like protein-domain-containing protein [Pseudoneurospora amorphoporcata]
MSKTAPAALPASTPQFRPGYDTCTEVTAICRVEYTTLGYYPNQGVNIFLAMAFGLCAIGTLAIGVWKKTWGYSIAITAGCILECAGYAARAVLSSNPWQASAFKTQIVSIILGPTLICIGLYLTLKHIVATLAPSLSPFQFRPKFYPLFFVPADVSCLVIQAIGGGIAASAGKQDYQLLQHGNRVIIAGIVLQVVVLGAFGVLSAIFLLRAKKHFLRSFAFPESEATTLEIEQQQQQQTWQANKTKFFVGAMVGAYACLLIRCVYRIAEMAGGWGNDIMQDEPSFVVLESFMVGIACVLFTVFAPGVWFPWMSYSEKVNPGLMMRAERDMEGGVVNVGHEMGETSSGLEHEKVVGV